MYGSDGGRRAFRAATVARQAGDWFFTDRARSYRIGFMVSWIVFAVGALLTPCAGQVMLFLVLLGGAFVLMFGLLVVLFPLYLVPHLRHARESALRIRENVTTKPT